MPPNQPPEEDERQGIHNIIGWRRESLPKHRSNRLPGKCRRVKARKCLSGCSPRSERGHSELRQESRVHLGPIEGSPARAVHPGKRATV